MLTIENSPSSSCPSQLSEVKSIEQTSQGVALEVAVDPTDFEVIPASKFSIRNYVFSSRSKDIQVNWPFARPVLQICLNHGVKDVLPPFESSSSVRAQCFRVLAREPDKPVVSSVLVKTLEHAKILEPGELESGGDCQSTVKLTGAIGKSCSPLTFICSDPVINSSSVDKESTLGQGTNILEGPHTDETIVTQEQTEQLLVQENLNSGVIAENNCSLEESVEPAKFEIVEPNWDLEKVHESFEKKCRLIVKFPAIPDSNQANSIASNTCSDTMASKVCPVCKMFTSTSNTTLNAHIDQCLFFKSDVNRDSISSLKPKEKKKKKRLMVDIYTTSRRCTLEDLDKRNGTNWAVELTSLAAPAPASEVVTLSKKPKLMYHEPRDEEDKKEVYVDSNGIKLRVLSKSIETTETSRLREELKLRKIRKDKKVNKNNITRKNEQFGYLKKMKMTHTMDLSSFKVSKIKIRAGYGRYCDEENHRTSDESEFGMKVNNCGGSSSRQWAYPKRPDVLGKFPSNKHADWDMIADTSEPGEYKFLARINHKKNFKTSKEMISSPKTTRVDSLYHGNKDMNDWSKCPKPAGVSPEVPMETAFPPKRLVLKLSRSAGTPISGKGKLYVHKQIAEGFDNASNTSLRPSGTRTASTPKKKELFLRETRNIEAIGKPSSSKIFRKHELFSRAGKRICFRSHIDQGVLGNQSLSSDVAARSRTVRPCQSKMPICASVGQVMNQVSPFRRNRLKIKRRLLANMLEDEEESAECLHFGAECDDGEDETTDNELDISSPENNETNATRGLALYDHTSDLEGKENMDITALKASLITEEEREHAVSGNEFDIYYFSENLQQSSDQKDKSTDVVSQYGGCSEDVAMADEAETSGAKDNLDAQSREIHTKGSSLQHYSGCLTSHRNLDTKVPQRTSSTSVRNVKSHKQELVKYEELTKSPASTVSLSSIVETNCIISEELVGHVRSPQVNAVVAAKSLEKICMTGVPNLKENTEEVHVYLPTGEHSWPDDDKPFCCSCISKDAKLSWETNNGRTAQVNQLVPNLFIGPRKSSSFTAYQSKKTDRSSPNSNFGYQNQAIHTKNLNDYAANYPTHPDTSSPRTPTQSNSNSILRLMGKNLTVVNSEELVQHQSSSLDYPSVRNDIQAGFSTACSLSDTNHFPACHHQILHGSPALVQPESMGSPQIPLHLSMTAAGGFVEPQFTSAWMATPDYQTQPRNIYERSILPRASYMTNGVIVIDDSHVPRTGVNGCLTSPTSSLPLFTSSLNPFPQRPFSYYPSQSQMTEVSTFPQPLYPNFYSSVSPTNFSSQGMKSEGQGVFLPGHVVFQSPAAGPIGSSVYYSHAML